MRCSVITPSYNAERYIERTIVSVLAQRGDHGVDLEYIVVDGGSTDATGSILDRHRNELAHCLVEPDRGPASAINKGLRLATGDILAWLNADDCYHPGTLARVIEAFEKQPKRALCLGHCRIVDDADREIRQGITRFKSVFYPVSCRPLIQTINYVSQPAMFFTRQAWRRAGDLREDLSAAFDYEFLLRLWRQGGAIALRGAPLADFRWHAASISARHFEQQFREEWEAAAADAGRYAPQTLAHRLVRAGIVGCYRRMARRRARREPPLK